MQSKASSYQVGERLTKPHQYGTAEPRDWEVAGHTEGGDLILRPVLAVTDQGAWSGGTVYGEAQVFSLEQVDNQFGPG